MDDLYALDGGKAAARFRKKSASRRKQMARNKERRKQHDARLARYERERKRRARIAKIEKAERAAFAKAREAEGYVTPGLPYKDLVGRRFKRLVVIRPGGHNPSGSKRWWVKCDCGSPEKEVAGTNLQQGILQSCGCIKGVALRLYWSKGPGRKKKAATAKERNRPLSYKLMKLRRKLIKAPRMTSEDAKILTQARIIVKRDELRRGVIKPRKGWKSDKYIIAA
jgi:hypothetical protein